MIPVPEAPRQSADAAEALDDFAMVQHTQCVRVPYASVNMDCVRQICETVYVSDEATIGSRLRALVERGNLGYRKTAERAGYKAASGIQRFVNPEYDSPLIPSIASKFARALVGHGQPPIRPEEIWELAERIEVAGVDTHPAAWIPAEGTLSRLVRAAQRVASDDRDRQLDVQAFSHGLYAGLRMLAMKPASENDPGFLAAVETQIAIAVHDCMQPQSSSLQRMADHN